MTTRARGFSWSGAAMALAVPIWLLCLPPAAFAQHHGGGGGGGHASGGGGGHATSRGGGGGGGHAVSGGSSAGGRSSGGTSSPRGGSAAVPRGSSGSGGSGNSGGGSTISTLGSRPRGDNPAIGQAVPRTGPAPHPGGGGYDGVYLPWGYGGLGLWGGYYGGYYDPWFDPWYGGYGYYPAPPVYYQEEGDGAIHLKVKPREAEVYVDGYYAGVVDDFDGIFQRLHVDAGPHRIEIRASGYEPLTFDIRVEPGGTVTYRGELKKIS